MKGQALHRPCTGAENERSVQPEPNDGAGEHLPDDGPAHDATGIGLPKRATSTLWAMDGEGSMDGR